MISRAKVMGSTVLAFVLLAGLPTSGSAQSCGHCRDYLLTSGSEAHDFGGEGALLDCGGLCHRASYNFRCVEAHSACTSALNTSIGKVRHAIERGDLRSLRAALAGLGNQAVVNRNKQTIDLLSCDSNRTIVARFPVSASTVGALARPAPAALMKPRLRIGHGAVAGSTRKAPV